MEYKNKTKNCQNCKKDFIIEPEDFNFYEKIKVPPPTWCPECRLIRRLAYRESRPLYKDVCDMCGKNIISIFAESSNIKAYCSSCWWGDDWDAMNYGKDYDFSKPFFQQFYELQKLVPREATGQKNSENCQYSNGDVRCKNCMLTFDCIESINCYNSQVAIFSKDSIDVDSVMNTDHTYENLCSNSVYNTKFIYFSDECLDCSFLFNCLGCSNCFGCVNLRNQKYCIFNKQYEKEEYFEMVEKIKKQMNQVPYIDRKGRVYKYGEFFPSELSLWGYNESWGHKYFPLTKEQALEKGFNWQENPIRDYKITAKATDLSDNIKDVADSILDEVIECEHNGKDCNQQCTEVFRILPNELQFYRQMSLALPRLCPICRHYERLKYTNPPKLWHRKCMCDGIESENDIYQNTIKHSHGDKPCQNEFETAISPDRKEIVYCKECYQAEFI